MEQQNSKCKHGQPIEQTRGLFCMCGSDVSRYQSQHQCHSGQINLMIEESGTCK